MLDWISRLFAAPASQQVDVIEQQAPSFEERLESILRRSRGMRHREDRELAAFIEDVDAALGILEQAIDILERPDLEARAVRVRTRLRKSRTRAANQRAAA